jgi:hypothetical protein
MQQLRWIMSAAGLAALTACGGTSAYSAGAAEMAEGRPAAAAAAMSQDRDIARIRAATAAFQVLDSAVAAGYPRTVAQCIQHQPHGAMGYHHVNRALLDDQIDIERPEILIYERTQAGEYVLNGVEYIIPYSIRPREATPPTVMNLQLKRSDDLQLWYLHAWVFKANPNGMFADWNPEVKC